MVKAHIVASVALCLPSLVLSQFRCPAGHGNGAQTERTPRADEVTSETTEIATDGISG
eukprot:COSAG05_NODE_12930_length_448_cov_1.461318_1_plen_57_part_10